MPVSFHLFTCVISKYLPKMDSSEDKLKLINVVPLAFRIQTVCFKIIPYLSPLFKKYARLSQSLLRVSSGKGIINNHFLFSFLMNFESLCKIQQILSSMFLSPSHQSFHSSHPHVIQGHFITQLASFPHDRYCSSHQTVIIIDSFTSLLWSQFSLTFAGGQALGLFPICDYLYVIRFKPI